ncbi:hypothetical protein PG989_000072 [Apiospora arundinis]
MHVDGDVPGSSPFMRIVCNTITEQAEVDMAPLLPKISIPDLSGSGGEWKTIVLKSELIFCITMTVDKTTIVP